MIAQAGNGLLTIEAITREALKILNYQLAEAHAFSNWPEVQAMKAGERLTFRMPRRFLA